MLVALRLDSATKLRLELPEPSIAGASGMAAAPAMARYHFGRFALDLRREALLADGAEIPLRPKSFTLLRHLVENADRLVTHDEIMHVVWPDVFVTDDNIAQCVMEIRRALGEDGRTMLRTISRRGYRFMAHVSRESASEFATSVPLPKIHEADDALDGAPGPIPVPMSGRPMLMVLPFADNGGDPEMAYFADGLSADLITDLTRFQELHVVGPQLLGSRSLGAQLPGTQRRVVGSLGSESLIVPEPADGAGFPRAQYVFSGSLRRAGGRIRVIAQLDDAQTGVRIWADRFDRSLDDLFAVQEDLADHIAALAANQIGRDGLRRTRRQSPANFTAYDWLLQGRDLHAQATETGNRTAWRMFERAIAADAAYASAYAHQSSVAQRGFTLGWGDIQGRAAIDKALELAQHAVALEPEAPLCLTRLAFTLSLLGRDDEAVETGRKAVMANPCDPASRHAYGEILSRAGRHETSIRELQQAISLNPFHPPFWRATLGRALLLADYPEQALAELRLAAALAPDYRPVHSSMVVACVETGRMDEARAEIREVLRLRPGWAISKFDGEFGLRRDIDQSRFVAAFRAAGMPER